MWTRAFWLYVVFVSIVYFIFILFVKGESREEVIHCSEMQSVALAHAS